MMKKIFKLHSIIVVFVFLLVVTSCTNNEVELLFEQTIKERTDAFKKKYKDILTAPENGWVGYYSPNDNFGAYIMLMNFNKDGSVSIKSDYEVGAKDNTITYRLDKTLKIELVLESHAVFSDIFEINNNDNGGEFVFNILSATQDKVILESKLDFGDDITIFTLKRASADDLNFDPVEIDKWFNNIVADGTQSVFRNILLNDEAIASFSFDPEIRVSTVKYLKDGETISENTPLVADATGFYFIKPLTLGDVTLTNFTFDEAANEYVNTEGNLKIKYENIPVSGTIDAYNIKKAYNRAGYNYLDAGTSSLAFYNFFTEFSANLPSNLNVTWFAFLELSSKEIPYLYIYTSLGNFWYDLSYEIRDNGRLYFTLTGDTNASAEIIVALKPLIELLIGDEEGYYTNLNL